MADFSIVYRYLLRDRFSGAAKKIATNARRVNKTLETGSKKLLKFSKNAGQVGRNLSLKMTAPILAIGAATLLTAGNFELAMNKVQALSGATGEQFLKLKNQSKELGATTQFTATQAANAQGFLALAGLKTVKILKAMPPTLQLAAAAQIDLGQSANIVTNIMAGYGMKASQLTMATDVLTKSFTSSKTDLVELGYALKYAGPITKGLGFSFAETAATLGLLAQGGYAGSLGGTALRGALMRLADPAEGTRKEFKSIFRNVMDASGQLKSMADIMKVFEKANISAINKMKIFGLKAGPAMLAFLRQGSGELERMTKLLENSGGTAERIAKVQMKGLIGALREVKSAAESVTIAAGESGLLGEATKLGKKLASFLRDLAKINPKMFRLAAGIALVAAGIGPLLIGLSAITFVVGTLISPVGLAVLSLFILAGVGTLLFFKWKPFGNFVKSLGKGLDKIVTSVANLKKITVGSAFKGLGKGLFGVGKEIFTHNIVSQPKPYMFGAQSGKFTADINIKAPRDTVESVRTKKEGPSSVMDLGFNLWEAT